MCVLAKSFYILSAIFLHIGAGKKYCHS